MSELIVIVGPIAAGKSSVAGALAERLRRGGRVVAVLDLDEVVLTVGGYVDLPPARFAEAQVVFGRLVAAWLDQRIDVIAHGPFFQPEEHHTLLQAVPEGTIVRWVYLDSTLDVAVARTAADTSRIVSRDLTFLRATYDRVAALRSAMPSYDWTFDTTTRGVEDIAAALEERPSSSCHGAHSSQLKCR